MFYCYLRYFEWFCIIFGLYFPFPTTFNKVRARWYYLWSIVVSVLFIVSYFYPNNIWFAIKVKTHLDQISVANNLIVNILIIVINIYNENKINRKLYPLIDNILRNLQIQSRYLKYFAIKFQIWMTLPFFVLITGIIMELVYANPPYALIVKMPIFLATSHLVLHLSLVLAVLKVVNLRITEKLPVSNNFFLEDSSKSKSLLHYMFCPTIKIFEVEASIRKGQYDLYFLCKIYDEIGISITLLEKSHGIQMLLSIWLMFSNAVTGVTLITKDQANMAWIVVIRSALPFFWYFTGCYVDNQLGQEVERTEMLIVKNLIDFRSDHSTREALQTFRQVVTANRLEFKACNLFRLNYATILGTVVNVITYSIILIQVL